MKKHVFDVNVVIDRTQVSHLEGPAGVAVVIPFTGSVTSDIFTGEIRPGAADVQTTNLAGVRHMDARYFIAGHDHTGAECAIFVENHGYFNGAPQGPEGYFVTEPIFRTDSKALAPYLHQRKFIGEGHPAPDGVTIKFFEVGDE